MEELRLDGKAILVTGGARGLGRAYTTLLAERGAQVLIVDRPAAIGQPDEARKVAEAVREGGGIATAHAADIGTKAGARGAVEAALQAFGCLDAVINNAGILNSHSFADYPEQDFEAILDVHVRGTWHVTQAAWPALVDSGCGRVINTVSRAAFFGEPADVAYSAAKAALYGFTRALALEGQSRGIKVNAICPAAWTGMFESARNLDEAGRAIMSERFKTSFVAPVVLLLAHERCPCNGEVIASVGGTVQRYFAAQTDGISVDDAFTAENLMASFDIVFDETHASPIDLTSYKSCEAVSPSKWTDA